MKRHIDKLLKRIFSLFLIILFGFSQINSSAFAQSVLNLPVPGTMINTTSAFAPTILRGITVDPVHPLNFDFLVDLGDDKFAGERLKTESSKLIKYFMASLTVPEEDLWVNLSPYEKNRVIPSGFSQTEMGRDLLAQDYMLKQLTASLLYPENEFGSAFWEKVYKKVQEKYGTTEMPLNTFNKVWIVPDKAVVYVHHRSAFVVESHLKVMLEEDYLALEANQGRTNHGLGNVKERDLKELSDVSKQVIREILIPEIEKEVNEGKTFSSLRQIYNSVILASWYKKNLRQSLLGKVYVDQNKIKGVDVADKEIVQKIYNQYLEAFKKGAYDYLKEDYDADKQEIVARKYVSGGAVLKRTSSITQDRAMTTEEIQGKLSGHKLVTVSTDFSSANGATGAGVELKSEDRWADKAQLADVVTFLAANNLYGPENARTLKEIAENMSTLERKVTPTGLNGISYSKNFLADVGLLEGDSKKGYYLPEWLKEIDVSMFFKRLQTTNKVHVKAKVQNIKKQLPRIREAKNFLEKTVKGGIDFDQLFPKSAPKFTSGGLGQEKESFTQEDIEQIKTKLIPKVKEMASKLKRPIAIHVAASVNIPGMLVDRFTGNAYVIFPEVLREQKFDNNDEKVRDFIEKFAGLYRGTLGYTTHAQEDKPSTPVVLFIDKGNMDTPKKALIDYYFGQEEIYVDIVSPALFEKRLSGVIQWKFDDINNQDKEYFQYVMTERYIDMLLDIAKTQAAEEPEEVSKADQAVTAEKPPGGIDLNPANMDLQTKGEQIDFQMPEDFRNIDPAAVEGFVPVIINITPVISIPLLLGEAGQKENSPLSLAR